MRNKPPKAVVAAATRSLSLILASLMTLLAGSARADAETDRFRHVYIPIEDLNVLFEQKKGVLLERQEFLDLWAKAKAAEKTQGAQLEHVVLDDAQYQAHVENNSLRIRARWKVVKQVPGWRQLTLPLAGVAIASAELDGKPTSLGLDEQGTPILILQETGEHVLELELAARLDDAKAAKIARFRVPPVPGILRVTAPDRYEVKVAGHRTDKEGSVFVIAMGGRSDVQLTLVPELDSGERPTVLFAKTALIGSMTPAQIEWRARFDLNAFAAPVDSVAVNIGADVEVVSVEASGLSRWQVDGSGADRRLTMTFATEWTGSRQLTVHATSPTLVDRTWPIPPWSVHQAASQTGTIELQAGEPLSLRLIQAKGARRLPLADQAAGKLLLEYWTPAYDAQVAVAAKTRKLAVGSVTILDVGRNEVSLTSSVTVEPRNGSIFDLQLVMQSGWYVRSIQVDGTPVSFQSLESNGHVRLHVDLPSPVADGSALALTVEADRVPSQWLRTAGEQSTVDLTTVWVEGADETEGVLLVRAPDDIRVQAASNAGLESVPTAGIPGADEQVRLALRYREAEVTGTLLASRKPARISVETHAVAVLRESHLLTRYSVTYAVRGGTTDTLTFDLEQVPGQSIAVSGLTPENPLVYQADKPVENRRRWTLRFAREIEDTVAISVRIETPRTEDRAQMPVLTVPGAVRQTGTIAVEGGLEQSVDVQSQGLRAIDPSELPTETGASAADRLVACYQYRRLPYSLSVAVQKFPGEQVLTAVCPKAMMQTVLDASGFARHRCVFHIQNQGLQKLAIQLPEQARLMSSLLNDQPVEVHRRDADFLIALPLATGDLRVEIFYESPTDPLTLLSQLQLQPPRLNLPVLQVNWTVHVPDSKVVVHSDGPIEPLHPLSRFTLLGLLREAWVPPGGRRIFNPLEPIVVGRAGSGIEIEAMAPQAEPAPTAADEQVQMQVEDQLTIDAEKQIRAPLPEIQPPMEGAFGGGQEGAGQPASPTPRRTLPLFRRGQADSNARAYESMLGGRQAAIPKGLLSLTLALNPTGIQYDFQGLRVDLPLQITVQDRLYSQSLTALVAIGAVLVGWLIRKRGRKLRSMFVACCLAAAIGLSAIVPLGVVYLLDGLFVGALILWALYIGRAILLYAASWIPWYRMKPTVAAVVCLCIVTGSARSESKEPTLYIPYRTGTPAVEADKVYVPKGEYDRLRMLVHPEQMPVADPDTPGLVSSMRLDGSVDGETASFQAEVTLWSFRDDWIQLQIPVADVVFSKIELDGAPATVAGQVQAEPRPRSPKPMPPSTFPLIYVRGRGQHRLALDFNLPVKRDGVTGELLLKLQPIAATSLQFQLPEDGLAIEAEGLTSGWQLEGNTLFAAVSHARRLHVRWAPPDARRSGSVVANVHQSSRITVSAQGIHRQAKLQYRIVRGAAERWEMNISSQAVVRDVRGSGIADWWIKGEAEQRTLVVTSGQPWTNSTELEIDLFIPAQTGVATEEARAIEVGKLQSLNVDRETGDLLIAADPRLRAAVRSSTGYQEIDPRGLQNLPAPAKEHAGFPVLAAFRFSTADRSVTLAVEPLQSELYSQVASAIIVRPQRTELRADVTLTQKDLPLVSSQLLMPKGFAVEAVRSTESMRWTQLETETHTAIEIEWLGRPPVQVGNQDSATVSITGWLARDAAAMQMTVPAIDVPSAKPAAKPSQWAVYLTPGIDAQTVRATGLRPIRPGELSSSWARLQLEYFTVTPRLAFEQVASPAQLELQLRLLQPRTRGTGVTAVSVRELAVAYVTQLQWHVEQAGIRTLQFTCPATLGEELNISGPSVRQVESEDVEPDRRRFRVTLDRPVLSDYSLHVVQTEPLPEDGIIQTPVFTFENMESQQQFVVLENLSPDQLDRVPQPQANFESIDVDAVPLPLADPIRNRALEVLRLQSNQGPTWRLQSSQQVATAPASVNLVDLLMVVDEYGGYRAQVNYRVSNRQEQFLALQMPENSTIWSLYVAGKPSRPSNGTRDNQPVLLIPLPRTAAGDFSSVVELVYTGVLDIRSGWLRTWIFPSPTVLDFPVAHTQWTLYLPERFDYTMIQGNMEEAEQAYLDLNRQAAVFREAIDLITQANYGKGSAKSRARSNLLKLDLGLHASGPVTSSKTQQLLQSNTATAAQLGEAVEQLREQPEPTTTAARQVQINQYFVPLASPPPVPTPKPTAKTEKLQDFDKESVRSRLQQRIQEQTEMLNRQVQQRQLEPRLEIKDAERFIKPGQDELDPLEGFGIEAQESTPRPGKQGGLSIRIELPTAGKPLHFSKVRGNPVLSMKVFPAQVNQQAMALAWLAGAFAFCLSVGWWIGRPSGLRRLITHWRTFLLTLGLLWWLLLPLGFIGFLMVTLALIAFALSFLFRLAQ